MYLNESGYIEELRKVLTDFLNSKMEIITAFILENELDDTVITELENININEHFNLQEPDSEKHMLGNLQNRILEVISSWLNCDDYEDLAVKLGA